MSDKPEMPDNSDRDETLKTLRLNHYFLIAVSTATLAFALAPNMAPALQNALAELQQIDDLDMAAYREFAYDIVAAQCQDRFKWLPSALVSELPSPAEIWKTRDASSQKVPNPVAMTPVVFVPHPSTEAPISEYINFFTKDHEIACYSPDPLSLVTVWNELTDLRAYGKDSFVFTAISFEAPDNLGPFGIAGRGQAILREPSDEGLVVAKNLGGPHAGFAGTMKFHFRNGSSEVNRAARVGLTPSVVKGPFARQWKFPDQNGATVFAALRPLLFQIRSMESGEAARYLEERIATAQKELSFAEISVDRQVAAWMAPLATLFILLFQFSHLQQTVRIRGTLGERLSSFPWVALFTSRTARVLTVVTGVGVPVVANALLVARATSSFGWSVLLRGVVVLLILVCAVSVVRLVHDLRDGARGAERDARDVKARGRQN